MHQFGANKFTGRYTILVQVSSTKLHQIGASGIGERLRQIRGNLSQEEFGRSLGVTRKQVADYESERTAPSPEFLEAVCTKLGTDLNWLLTGLNKVDVDRRFDELVEISRRKQTTPEEDEILAILRTLGITNRQDFHIYFDYARAVQDKAARDKKRGYDVVPPKYGKAAEGRETYSRKRKGK